MQRILAEAPLFGPYEPYVMKGWHEEGWADWVTEATGGRLTINVVAPNSAFPNAEVLTNIGKGTIEAAFTSTGYAGGVMPEAYILGGLHFAWTDAAEGYEWYYQRGGYEMAEEAWNEHNVTHIPSLEDFPLNLAVMFPCDSYKTVAGKKIRVYGAQVKYIEAIGGLPVAIPYAEAYQALKLGTVEGATLGIHALEDSNLKEVVSGYVAYPSTFIVNDSVLMNMDAFQALPDDIKAIISRDSKHYMNSATYLSRQSMKYVAGQAGVTLYSWPEEEVLELRKMAEEKIWPEFGSASPRCQELLDSIKAQMREHGKL
jgi:TRAP-type C4-dicarboxylate transport system substrate-binding protein